MKALEHLPRWHLIDFRRRKSELAWPEQRVGNPTPSAIFLHPKFDLSIKEYLPTEGVR